MDEGPVETVLSALRHQGKRVGRTAGGHIAQCPAHPDGRPSLKIDAGDRGALLSCYAGCRAEDVAVALGLTLKDLFYESYNDTYAPPGVRPHQDQKAEATYVYKDEAGQPVFRVLRYPHKRFSQERYDGSQFVPGMAGVARIPYRLDELLASHGTVYIVEGEKDADALVRAGFTATSAVGGSGKGTWKAEWAHYFHGRHVVVIRDKDEPGRAHADRIRDALRDVAGSVRVVQACVGKDVSDHLTSGLGVEDLVPIVTDEPDEIQIRIYTWEEFREAAHEEPPMLIDGLWSHGAFGFIAGAPKARKTWLGLAAAIAVASGKPLLGHAVPDPESVLYMALEGSHSSLRQRFGCLMRGYELDPDRGVDNLHIMYRPPHMNLMVRSNTEQLRRTIHDVEAKLVFIDVLRAATVFDENSASDFSKLMANLRPILNDGVSIAVLHHFSKWGDTNAGREPGDRMVGSGAMRGALDVGLYLTNVAGSTRVDSEARDLTMPAQFSFSLSGLGSGANGGFTYRDTCVLAVNGDGSMKQEATAEKIAAWIKGNGGSANARTICALFGVSDSMFRTMANELAKHGVLPRGKGSSLVYETVTQMGITA